MQTMPGRRYCTPSDLAFTESLYPQTNTGPDLTSGVRDAEFLSMLFNYRRSGGLARSQEMASIFASRSASIGTLARWVFEGEVFTSNGRTTPGSPCSSSAVPTYPQAQE